MKTIVNDRFCCYLTTAFQQVMKKITCEKVTCGKISSLEHVIKNRLNFSVQVQWLTRCKFVISDIMEELVWNILDLGCVKLASTFLADPSNGNEDGFPSPWLPPSTIQTYIIFNTCLRMWCNIVVSFCVLIHCSVTIWVDQFCWIAFWMIFILDWLKKSRSLAGYIFVLLCDSH